MQTIYFAIQIQFIAVFINKAGIISASTFLCILIIPLQLFFYCLVNFPGWKAVPC